MDISGGKYKLSAQKIINETDDMDINIYKQLNDTTLSDMSKLLNMSVSEAKGSPEIKSLCDQVDSVEVSLANANSQLNIISNNNNIKINFTSDTIQNISNSLNDESIQRIMSLKEGDWDNIPTVFNSISSTCSSVQLDDVEYSVEDLIEEAENAIKEFDSQVLNGHDTDLNKHRFWKELETKHPVLFKAVNLIIWTGFLMGSLSDINNVAEIFKSIPQDVSIMIEDKEDICYVHDLSGVMMYQEPNSHSDELIMIPYGDSATLIDETGMWTKIIYVSDAEDGKTYIGWIATAALVD